MKKVLLLLTIFTIVTACSINKKPTFKQISTIQVKNISLRNVTVIADAVFDNPNHLKGTLSLDDIHIFVDNIDVGIISSQEFDVPAQEEFTIPLQGSFSLSKIYKDNKSNLLNSVLKLTQTDSLIVQYKGKIRYHLGNFSYPYKINEEQKISLQ